MTKIFISYRRADSQHFTDHLYSELRRASGIEDVFQDVESLLGGQNFPKVIRSEIEKRDVLLIVIGDKWGDILQDRAGDDKDYLRIEVEAGLAAQAERGKLIIIPVLVGDARLPVEVLPESIIGLGELNAHRIRPNPYFDTDFQKLVRHIREMRTGRKRKREKFTMPLLEWVTIPAGDTYLRHEQATRTDRMETHVPAFEIMKYPVTVAQYDMFIKQGGYTDPKWGLDMTEPTPLPHFSKPDHPRVNVDLYEAQRFCEWLSKKTGDSIRLPTEAEWQRAAHGDDMKQNYPWKGSWESKRCNCKELHAGTTPVNYYDAVGLSPFGVADMSGNVYEWTGTIYKHEYYRDGAVFHAIKGGAWDGAIGYWFRITDRVLHEGAKERNNLGFRCVRELK